MNLSAVNVDQTLTTQKGPKVGERQAWRSHDICSCTIWADTCPWSRQRYVVSSSPNLSCDLQLQRWLLLQEPTTEQQLNNWEGAKRRCRMGAEERSWTPPSRLQRPQRLWQKTSNIGLEKCQSTWPHILWSNNMVGSVPGLPRRARLNWTGSRLVVFFAFSDYPPQNSSSSLLLKLRNLWQCSLSCFNAHVFASRFIFRLPWQQIGTSCWHFTFALPDLTDHFTARPIPDFTVEVDSGWKRGENTGGVIRLTLHAVPVHVLGVQGMDGDPV